MLIAKDFIEQKHFEEESDTDFERCFERMELIDPAGRSDEEY